MSQSPEEAGEDEVDDYTYGWLATSQLLSEGGSLSGREKNCFYLNTGDGRFADGSWTSGLDFADDGRAVALVDWDFDGAVDVFFANRTGPRLRLMRNTFEGGRFVSLYLLGTQCNRDAVGARLEVFLENEEVPLIRTVRSGDSFLSQTSKWQLVGLGDGEIERVIVRWPGGEKEEFAGVSEGGHFVLKEGSGTADTWQAPQIEGMLSSEPAPKEDAGVSRVSLAGRFQVPGMSYLSAQGQKKSVPSGRQPVLLLLWAEWCETCRGELEDLVAAKRVLEKTGVEVLALSVDEIGAANLPDEAAAFLKEAKWPYQSGQANEELLDQLDVLQRVAVNQRRPMPVPSSFLFDRHGRLAVVYRGPVAVGRLLADARELDAPAEKIFEQGLPFPGRWVNRPQAGPATANEVMFEFMNAGFAEVAEQMLEGTNQNSSDEESEAIAHLNLGVQRLSAREFQLAEESFRKALEVDEKMVKARLGLAKALAGQGRRGEASSNYFEVIQLDPQNAEAQFEVGRAYISAGKGEEAVRHLELSLELSPQALPTINVLARVLATHPEVGLRDPDRAKQLATQAVELSGREDFQSLETLAAVAASRGEYAEAILATEKVIGLLPQTQIQRIEANRKRLEAWRGQSRFGR